MNLISKRDEKRFTLNDVFFKTFKQSKNDEFPIHLFFNKAPHKRANFEILSIIWARNLLW